MSVLTAVSIFDTHHPYVDEPTWAAAMDFMARNPVGLFIFGGDNLDCGPISHHTKNKPLFRPRGQMKKDLDSFRAKRLEQVEKRMPKGAVKVWLTGNHEDWAAQLIEEQPELEGLLDFPAYLDLAERGWIVKGQGGHFKHGHLKYLHGDVLSGGPNAARKALDIYVESVAFGHFHTMASATKVLPNSSKYKWQAWSMPCMGHLDAHYLKKAPTGWINGFGITEFFGRGYFSHFPVNVISGQFAYGGKLYGGRK